MIQPFQMPGQQGSLDDTGIIQWTVPYFVENLADVLTVGQEPPLKGLVETGRTWTDNFEGQGAGVQVTVTYEGGGLSDKVSYEYDSSFREEIILSHPNWEQFKNVFKGRYDKEEKRVEFPEYIDKGGKLGLDQGQGPPTPGAIADARRANQVKNPLFGVETYLALASVFRMTYSASSVPAGIFTSIGTIRQSLPGGFPTPENHDWLVMPPKVSQRGGSYQITEEYMMSKPGGWPEAIYSLIN